VRVRVAGKGVVSHVGSALLRLLGDRAGLTDRLSRALRVRGFFPDIDRGRILADLAVAVADGATAIDDLRVLRDQGGLFGPVASTTTAWRCLKEIDGAQLGRIERARAKTRAWVWQQIVARHGRIPPAATCYGDLGTTIVVRLDASIVIAHSDKIGAKGTFKGTYGHHPLLATCDNTGELLVALLRPGNAGSNTGTDHVKVLDAALAQIPWPHRRDLLVTIDGAGAGHMIVDHITALNARHGYTVQYSIGFDLDERARTAISRLPHSGWEPALDAQGRPRDDAHVAELTGLLRHSAGRDQLSGWPTDLRVIARREPIPAGMQVSLFEQHDGYRYQLLATNTTTGQLQRLEARHRVHARVEDGVRNAKATGLRRLPSKLWGINDAWCQVVALAVDLLAWLRHLALTGDLAKAEPKTLRYRLLHTAARITHGQRQRWLNIPPDWPWAGDLATAFSRVMALPAPT
jgi:Transposase DDE domain group 1